MTTLTINNPAGVNLADLTRHSSNMTASSVTTTTATLQFTDGWEVVASGSFEYQAATMQISGTANSFQVFRPGHVLEYSAIFDPIDAATIAAFAGAFSVVTGFSTLQDLVLKTHDLQGRDPSVIGGSGNDTYDTLWSSVPRVTIDGGDGVDTIKFDLNRSYYVIEKTESGFNVDRNGDFNGSTLKTLSNVERLIFQDKTIALDVTPEGNTGKAMEFLGAVAPTLMNDTSIRGLIISLFDQGQTMESLSQLALNLNLLPSTTNAALANAVCHNVLGAAPNADLTNILVGFIESHGQANFVATVAGLHLNVDLVGLQQTGVEYLI